MNKMKRVYGFVGICFCLCFHLSLSSPLLLGHPPLHGASPLWPGWREESAGPAFLSASSFHLACLFSKQIFLFIYPRDSLWRSSLALPRFFSFFPLYFPPLPGPLSLILSCVRCATSALAHLIPETLKEREQGVWVTHVANTFRHAQSLFTTQDSD